MCTCPMVYCGDQRATSMNWIFAPRLWLCFRTLFLERSKTAHSFQRVNWKQSNVRIQPKFKSVDQQAFVARITGVWWRVTYRKRNNLKIASPETHTRWGWLMQAENLVLTAQFARSWRSCSPSREAQLFESNSR